MKKLFLVTLSLVLWAVLFLTGYVFSASEHIPPHFHANFAMYVNGERVDFSWAEYSEDIAGCSITGEISPKDRVHLHENNPDTIHVHASGVSWGHFFANNNFWFWENYLSLDSGEIYQNNDLAKMQYMINGKITKNPFNKAIWSKDRLLINYWNLSEEELLELYETLSDNAGEYNAKYDPGSCGGTSENGILVILREFVHSYRNMEH
jgi:hypothetical protein